MEDAFSYLNTDLYLCSADDLTALGAAFEAGGFLPLQLARDDDGLWYANFEVRGRQEEPEATIAVMLAVLESLGDELQADWSKCQRREFDIGYDCGSKPWAFNQGLSSQLLGRIAAVGASLRITLYPQVAKQNAEPDGVMRSGPS